MLQEQQQQVERQQQGATTRGNNKRQLREAATKTTAAAEQIVNKNKPNIIAPLCPLSASLPRFANQMFIDRVGQE